ncbi:MAG: glycosyltransferase [Pseudomonadota bacterium]
MNLLHVIRSLDARGGGPQEGLKQIVLEMDRAGWGSEVASLDAPDELSSLSFPAMINGLGPARGGYGYAPGAVRWLRANAPRFDAVVVHGLWQYHGLATWRALQGLNVPYFVFPHGMLDPWFRRTYPMKHAKKWLYWPWAEYRVLRDATNVLFTCEQERVLARDSFWLYRAREAVAGFGIEPPKTDETLDRRAFLDAFPALAGRRLLLYLSRIHPKKGCDLLVRAFAATSAEHDLHLVMAGPDDEDWVRSLRALSTQLGVADRISWTGMLTGAVKWGAYHASEAFILPSHQENFGIVVAEALALRRPVLISDQVNIYREIQADDAGIIASDTLEGTIALIRGWMTTDENARAAMAGRAVDCFQNHFHIRASAARLRAIVSEGVARHRSPALAA